MTDQATTLTADQNKAPQAGESDLLRNIVSTETGDADKAILGEAPELDTSLLQDIGPQKSVLLLTLKILFSLLFIASIASVVFFTSQLTNIFDFATARFNLPNISQELASSNSEIISLQTDLNLNRYLQIKAAFDKFSYDGDEFIQSYEIFNSQTSSAQEKDQASDGLTDIKKDLKESLLTIQTKISGKFLAPLIDVNFSENAQLQSLYEEKLRNALNEKISSLSSSTDSQTKRDVRNYQQILKLIGNTELKNLITQADFDALKDEEIYNFIKQVNSLIVNDLSVIHAIKNKRIKWSDVIDEIDLRTMAVDSHFDDNFYDDLGGIRYTSYDFDTSARKISISGETKTIDTTNFTTIVNLIDELNQSKFFQSAEMRSFSKSGSLDDGYTATLKLTFDLK